MRKEDVTYKINVNGLAANQSEWLIYDQLEIS